MLSWCCRAVSLANPKRVTIPDRRSLLVRGDAGELCEEGQQPQLRVRLSTALLVAIDLVGCSRRLTVDVNVSRRLWNRRVDAALGFVERIDRCLEQLEAAGEGPELQKE